jgi:D-alanine-D-alanine ligase
MALEGAPHALVTRSWLEGRWGQENQGWARRFAWPLSDQVWATWPEDPEEWRPFNHSCDPNVWLDGLNLQARRSIAPGDEIRVDFATFGTNALAPFDCACGAEECRKRIHRDDHLRPFLDRYGPHVSDFVRSSRVQSELRSDQ